MNHATPSNHATAPGRPQVHRHFHRLAWLAVALTLAVVVFGAFVRLSDAGLSCPDWPTCYGRAAWPTQAEQAADHAATAIRPVEPHKAWREQVHRHAAAILGLLVLGLALLAARKRRLGVAQILGASGWWRWRSRCTCSSSTWPRRCWRSRARRSCCWRHCAGATSTSRAPPRSRWR
jgi:heme a synthase